MNYLNGRDRAVVSLLAAAFGLAAGCSGGEGGTSDETLLPVSSGADAGANDAAATAEGAAPQSAAPAATTSDAGGMGFSVPSDSHVCGEDLPFKPKGCTCEPGQTSPCWTGPADQRHVGDCKDGLQKCLPGGEFALWGECEGQVLDCGEPPPDPPPQDCPCVPGEIIGCDEDCEALVFCAPFSTKVCQPDGTFGPCREALDQTLDGSLCINVFHGCLAENPEGVFVGDCSQPFTCGHPPGDPPEAPPETPTVD